MKKTEVFGAKKLLKNLYIAIFEDLLHKLLLKSAKKKFGNNKVWSAGGKILAWSEKNGKKNYQFS